MTVAVTIEKIRWCWNELQRVVWFSGVQKKLNVRKHAFENIMQKKSTAIHIITSVLELPFRVILLDFLLLMLIYFTECFQNSASFIYIKFFTFW